MSIARLLELEREISRLHALQAEVLVEIASPDRQVEDFVLLDATTDDQRRIRIEDFTREEISAALRWSPSMANARIESARLLVGPLREVKDALMAGEIAPAHVTVFVEHAGRLPGAVDRFRFGPDGEPDERAVEARSEFAASCAELTRRVLPTARRATVARTRDAARRAVLAIDAEGERRRRERARCQRNVFVIDALDGLSTIVARLATEDAHALMSLIDGAARESADPELTMGERRAEALAALALGHDAEAGPRVQAHIDLVVDLPTFLGLADNAVELCGADPLGADAFRELLADPRVGATLRRLVADPITGHLLDRGRRSYDIPVALREFVVARDGVCRFPGCRRQATSCQIDHAMAWDDGGSTDVANLGALCVRHHQLKTHAGWDIVDSRADGSCTWRSPHGRRYEHRPRPFLAAGESAGGAGPRGDEVAPPPQPPDPEPPPF